MKAVVAVFNQEKALVGAFSVITILRMELFQALAATSHTADKVHRAIFAGSKDHGIRNINDFDEQLQKARSHHPLIDKNNRPRHN